MRRLPRKIPSAVRTPFRAQRGFLLVTAVTLIVIAALLVAVMVFFTATGTHSSARNLSAKQALYIAGTGLERGTRLLLSPVLSEQISCAAVTGDANLTNATFGAGQFTVTGGTPEYSANATTLSFNIGATDSTIAVVDVTGYAAAGRVLIDRETIDYSDVEPADDTICGGVGRAPCLVGAQRGRDGTVAAAHAGGTPVGQYQCDLQSQGGVPDLVNVRGKRTLQESVQLQEAWAVGDRSGNNFTFARWNQPVETQWTNASFSDAANRSNLNAVSMLNYADGWAVGDSRGNNFTLVHRTGAGWSAQPLTDNANRTNLNGVYCIASDDCWAVGDSRGNNFTLIHRTGAGWSAQPLNNNNRANLNGVYCVESDDCWAVGDSNGNNFTFVRRTAAGWSAQPLNNNNRTNLYGVHCVSTGDCWAVGRRINGSNRWTLLHWDGATWTRDAGIPRNGARNLNAVTLLDTNNDGVSDDGWAVGDSNGGGTNRWTFLRRNGASWARVTVNTPGTGAQNLNAVDCATANDCWAAGNGGIVLHWDGTSWSRVAVAGVGQSLRGISMISHHRLPRAAWREVFQ